MSEVKITISALDKTKEAFQSLTNSFKAMLKDSDNFKLKVGELEGAFKSLIGAATLYKVSAGLKESIDTFERTGNSLRGLAAVARYSGESIGASIQAGADLASDGLLNVQASSQALQNLLSRGFSLQESIQIIERLKDAAAFNRQSHLSMSEAVTSATEGLKNENSILVDNAGVTKNVSIMWKEYAASIGKGANDLSQAEKRQAEFNGIMRETEGQVGNAKLALEGITGTKAKLSQEVFKLKNALGESLTPAFLEVAKAVNWVLENAIKPFLGGIEIMGMKAAETWEKIKLSFKAPFMDPKEFHRQWAELTKIADEQAAEIVKKYSGAVNVPEIGKDSGKRRQDVVAPPDTKAAEKAAADYAAAVEKRSMDAAVGLMKLAENLSAIEKERADATEKAKKDEYNTTLEIMHLEAQGWAKDLENLNHFIEEKKKKDQEASKSWYEGMQDFQASLSAISSGSIAQIAGLMGEYGKMAGAVIEFISNIGKLPDLLKASIKGLVEGAKDFGQAIVTIIKDIIVNLPTILAEIIIELVDSVDEIIEALIDGIPKFVTNLVKAIPAVMYALIAEIPQVITALIQGIPQLIVELISGIWEGIKAIFFGGEIKSAVSDWTEEASTVTVELDTTDAMNALMYAQDALIGALNETDRAVAREALLSAREAAILAERNGKGKEGQAADAFSKSFDGIFGMLGDFLDGLWDTITGAFKWAWDGLQNIVKSLWDWVSALGQTLWDGLSWLWNGGLSGVLSDAWTGLSNALSWLWDGGLSGVLSDAWTGLSNVLSWLWDGGLSGVLSDAWTGLSNALSWLWDGGLAGLFNDIWNGLGETLTGWLNALGDMLGKIFGWAEDAFNYTFGGGLVKDAGDSITSLGGLAKNDDGYTFGMKWHDGGLLKRAHEGMFLGEDLESYEVPIIAKFGEGILNDYNGMKAIGGEAGLNFANKNGYLPGGGQTIISQPVTQNISLTAVLDRSGNLIQLTKSEAKNFLRGLAPTIKEMQRNGELNLA